MNRPQFIIFGAIGVITLVAILLTTGIVPGLKERPPELFTLSIWGSEDEPELWQTIGQTYHEEVSPSATVEYIKKDPQTYETELLNALAAGRGPDVFLLEDTTLKNYQDKIYPLPDGSLDYQERDLKNVFADGALNAITDDSGALLATPLSLDTLALFYNRDYLNAANIPLPPATWEELVDQARILTKLSSVGGIQRSAIALGTATNVEHAADILAALIYQSGGAFISPAGTESALDGPTAVSALSFYTAFANSTRKTYTWNAFFESSLRAFARGDTAMAIGYAADIAALATENPQLNFDVAPLPQSRDAKTPVTLGRIRLLAIPRTSGNKEQAWRFLLWLQSKEIQKTYTDAVGLPSARRDLIRSKPPQEYLATFYDQVLSAKTLPIALGDSLSSILRDTIESVTNRRFSVDAAISRAVAEINTRITPQE